METLKIRKQKKLNKDAILTKVAKFVKINRLVFHKKFDFPKVADCEAYIEILEYSTRTSTNQVLADIHRKKMIRPQISDVFFFLLDCCEILNPGRRIVFLHEYFPWSGFMFYAVVSTTEKETRLDLVSPGEYWTEDFTFAAIKQSV